MVKLNSKRLSYATKIIITTANYWSNKEYYAANRDDLINEGWIVFFRLLRLYDFDKPIDLYKTLAKSCQRRFIDILRRSNTERKRIAENIDAFTGVAQFAKGRSGFEEIEEHELVTQISENLDEFQKRVLHELVFPSRKAQDIAVADGRRRFRLHSFGIPWLKGYRTISVKKRHVAQALGTTDRRVRDAIRDIKKVCVDTQLIIPRKKKRRTKKKRKPFILRWR